MLAFIDTWYEFRLTLLQLAVFDIGFSLPPSEQYCAHRDPRVTDDGHLHMKSMPLNAAPSSLPSYEVATSDMRNPSPENAGQPSYGHSNDMIINQV